MKKLAGIVIFAAVAGGVFWLRPWRSEEARERIPGGSTSPTHAERVVSSSVGEQPGPVSEASSGAPGHAEASKTLSSPQVVVPIPAPGLAASEVPVAKRDNSATLETIRRAAARYDASAAPELDRYLLSADPEVREAARDGMVQAGDAAAVPFLRAAAGKMKDPREAILLLDAADFLELPAALPVKKTPPQAAAPGGMSAR